MFKWEIIAEKNTKGSPEDIWNIWKDVSNWPKWDHDLEWSRINGEFTVGTMGVLKPKGWFSSEFKITDLALNRSHTETTYMPMTTLTFLHQLEKVNDGKLKITHKLTVAGLLAPLLWCTMRLKLKKTVPEALDNLIKNLKF